jgi:regulatory protein
MSHDEPNRATARNHALRKLNRRECSSHEILTALLQKGVSTELASQVVQELTQSQLISDERFASMFVRYLIQQGKGPHLIRQKLKLKGIHLSLEQIKELSQDSSEMSEAEQARRIIERKYPKSNQDRAEKNRAIQALMRRGFSYSTIRDAFTLWSE